MQPDRVDLPTEGEKVSARSAGIEFDDTTSGTELRRKILEWRHTGDQNMTVRAMCQELGIDVPDGMALPHQRRAYAEGLPEVLRDRSIVEGARIFVPEGLISLWGMATVGAKLYKQGRYWKIQLRFDSDRRMFAYDAHRVAVHAQVRPE